MNARAGAGALLAAVCLAAAARPAAAKIRFFPLPMYTTVPNEGSTYGAMPVFMVPADDDPDRVKSITAPSLSWNSSAGVTGDRPLLPVPRAAPLLRTCCCRRARPSTARSGSRTTTTAARRAR